MTVGSFHDPQWLRATAAVFTRAAELADIQDIKDYFVRQARIYGDYSAAIENAMDGAIVGAPADPEAFG